MLDFFLESRHGSFKCRYCRNWIPQSKAERHSKECPCLCSQCGGEKDAEGWCPSYCMDSDRLEASTTGLPVAP